MVNLDVYQAVRSYGTARLSIILGLTALWWACAVGVTVIMKVALGGAGSDGRRSDWAFPYPLTLTLFANIGTAAVTGLLSLAANSRQCAGSGQSDPTSTLLHPLRSPGVTRVLSRENLNGHTLVEDSSATQVDESREDSTSHADGGGAADSGCGGPSMGSASGGFGPGTLFRACCGSNAPRRTGWHSHPEPVTVQAPTETVVLPDVDTQEPRGVAETIASKCWVNVVKGLTAVTSGGRATVVVIGLLQGLALGVKNEALLLLSVSTRTMIFATNVLAVLLIARLCGLEQLRRLKLLSAVLLAIGGVLQGLATLQHMQSSTEADSSLGCALAVLALLLDALRWVLLQAVFTTQDMLSAEPAVVRDLGSEDGRNSPSQGVDTSPPTSGARPSQHSPLTKFTMVSWVMWMATPLCLLLSIVFEPTGLSEAWERRSALVRIVALLTVGVIGINLTEFGVVQWTSAVTFNVLSQLHSIPMVLAGVVCFGEDVSVVQGLGFFVCLVGAVLYSWAKAKERCTPQVVQEGEAAASFDWHCDDSEGDATLQHTSSARSELGTTLAHRS
mmetsp:Transcript_78300/g.227103  ORF Transcript_78300/g.227103 Transcript_78300/m.227103 type:complete len:559 (-) Transcript_78300:48-1724(-)